MSVSKGRVGKNGSRSHIVQAGCSEAALVAVDARWAGAPAGCSVDTHAYAFVAACTCTGPRPAASLGPAPGVMSARPFAAGNAARSELGTAPGAFHDIHRLD